MKIYTFKYTKENGSASTRVLMPERVPYDKYSGLDISSMEEQEQGMFLAEVLALKDEYKTKLLAIQEKYDIVHNYRTFLPARMTEVTDEVVV